VFISQRLLFSLLSRFLKHDSTLIIAWKCGGRSIKWQIASQLFEFWHIWNSCLSSI
jgi:hypothetical protein